MIERKLALEIANELSVAISTIIEDVHPVTVEYHVHGDRSREDLLIEAGEDVLALARAIMVLKRRGQHRPDDLAPEPADDA